MNDHLSSRVLNKDTSKPGGSLVLLVEDDRKLAEEIRLDLEAGGHMVHVADTLTEGRLAAQSGDVAVLVVNRTLDGENGLSIVQALRGEGKWTPALAISGIASVDDRIAGLKAGCDDYLVKPFDVRELTARVEALLRRLDQEGGPLNPRSAPTIEDVVRSELRPLLKSWLDENLPGLVERLVRAEIEKLVSRSLR